MHGIMSISKLEMKKKRCAKILTVLSSIKRTATTKKQNQFNSIIMTNQYIRTCGFRSYISLGMKNRSVYTHLIGQFSFFFFFFFFQVCTENLNVDHLKELYCRLANVTNNKTHT